jgi:hypothetical protein
MSRSVKLHGAMVRWLASAADEVAERHREHDRSAADDGLDGAVHDAPSLPELARLPPTARVSPVGVSAAGLGTREQGRSCAREATI